MRQNPFIIIGIFLFLLLAIDFYTFKGVRHLTANWNQKWRFWLSMLFWAIPVIIVSALIVLVSMREYLQNNHKFHWFFYFAGLFILIYVPKLTFIVFQLVEDIIRGIAYLINLPLSPDSDAAVMTEKISRAKFLSQAGVIIATIPFISILYGIIAGRFNYKISNATIAFDHLPDAFDGFKIIQISDIHLGSFGSGNYEKVKHGIDLINEQNPDLIVFTGDMVNNTATELDQWIELLSQLKATYGKYSVLGNHDYGEYVDWQNDAKKAANLQNLIKKQGECGFRLLLNQNATIEKQEQQLALIGVENWGKPPFPQYGNYQKAVHGATGIPFKILLSHDPSHWDIEIREKTDVALTLSGHTHGMQFVINAGNRRWSPIQWKYKHWSGLYSANKQHLYVNTGFGYIGFPGRIGVPPEIAVLTLKKA